MVSKPVEPARGSNPDVAFAVLVDPVDGLAGEALPAPEAIAPSLVEMPQPVEPADPQAAVPRAEKRQGPLHTLQRVQPIGLDLPAGQPFHAVVDGEEERAAVGLGERPDIVSAGRKSEVLRGPGLPAPHARMSGDPEFARRVLVRVEHGPPKAFIDLTIDRRSAVDAKPAGCVGSKPEGSSLVLEEGIGGPRGESRVCRELAVLPAREALVAGDPQRAATRDEQPVHAVGRDHLLPGHRRRGGPHSVEPSRPWSVPTRR
jgi:hypothetical protein